MKLKYVLSAFLFSGVIFVGIHCFAKSSKEQVCRVSVIGLLRTEYEELCDCLKPYISEDIRVFEIDIRKIDSTRTWLYFLSKVIQPSSLDDVTYGYFHKVGSKWTLVEFGSAITDDELDRSGVPQEVRGDKSSSSTLFLSH